VRLAEHSTNRHNGLIRVYSKLLQHRGLPIIVYWENQLGTTLREVVSKLLVHFRDPRGGMLEDVELDRGHLKILLKPLLSILQKIGSQAMALEGLVNDKH
jgi:hypothetical protein